MANDAATICEACRRLNEYGDPTLCVEIGCPFYGEPDGCSHPTGYRTVGNSAAMYAALVKVKKLFDGRIMFQPAIREAHKAVNAALAAPPRNCDIYLTEEAVDAATMTVRDCKACSRIDMEAPCVFCMVRWLLAPAKEGGAK